jgi:PAS domain S-box-containing protein
VSLLSTPPARYGLAVAWVALDTVARLVVDPLLGDRHPFSLYYIAVLVAVALHGFGPAVLAVLSAACAASYFFVPPYGSLWIEGSQQWFGMALFVVTSAGIVTLGQMLSRARRHAERQAAALDDLRGDLEARVLERTEELRSANERLHLSEGRLAGIFGSAMDAIVLVDEDETVTMLNAAAEHMLGVAAADAVGRPIEGFLPVRVRPRHHEHVQEFSQQAGPGRRMGERGNITALRADGREFPVEVSIARVVVGAHSYFTVILRDITDRLANERALQTSKTQLEEALAAGRMGTWLVDFPSGAVQWDDANLGIWGRTREEFGDGAMETILGWIHPDDRASVAEVVDNMLRDGGGHHTDVHIEYRIVRGDGMVRWISSVGRVDRDAHGVPIRYTGVTADDTDRKRAGEEQLRSQKLEALGTLSGGIAHDFNNIVLAISGNARLASDELPAHHPVQASLREILRAATRASDVVKHILAFSRPHDHRRVVVPLASVVDEALTLLRATVPARVEFRRRFDAATPLVDVDAGELHQVVVNLTTNAAHAIAGAGAVEFAVDAVTVGDGAGPTVPGLAPGAYVRLAVTDTGTGMDRATVERAFDPFFSTKPTGAGTGLGLSVVHGIVKSHGGGITVESTLGVGTTFQVFLPAAANAERGLAAPAATASRGRGEHILYVDDEAPLVTLASRILMRNGYLVTGHTNPAVALDDFRARADTFDAVVTDLAMPHMPGFELVEGLRAIRPDIPVVMTSGYVRDEDEAAATRLGVHAILLKPDTMDGLGLALDDVFRAARATRGDER